MESTDIILEPHLPPPLEIVALNRMAFGPQSGDAERVRGIGLGSHVNGQIFPNNADEPACDHHRQSARLLIQYGAGKDD